MSLQVVDSAVLRFPRAVTHFSPGSAKYRPTQVGTGCGGGTAPEPAAARCLQGWLRIACRDAAASVPVGSCCRGPQPWQGGGWMVPEGMREHPRKAALRLQPLTLGKEQGHSRRGAFRCLDRS
jgi:hypothetical protein